MTDAMGDGLEPSAGNEPSVADDTAPKGAEEATAESTGAPQDTAAAPDEPAADTAPEVPASPALELYFLRHADAGDPMTWAGDDGDRPLSKKGRRQARRLGRLLADLNLHVTAILTSPRARSADTARIVGKAVGTKPHVDDRLSLDFGEAALASLVAGLDGDARSVILVGHDPDFTHLVSWLVGASITMRKGSLARIDLADRTVSGGHGSLRWLVPPDALP